MEKCVKVLVMYDYMYVMHAIPWNAPKHQSHTVINHWISETSIYNTQYRKCIRYTNNATMCGLRTLHWSVELYQLIHHLQSCHTQSISYSCYCCVLPLYQQLFLMDSMHCCACVRSTCGMYGHSWV